MKKLRCSGWVRWRLPRGRDALEQVSERHGFADRLRLPDCKFNRGIGMFSSVRSSIPQGHQLSDEESARRKYEWLPAPRIENNLLSIQASPVDQPGKFANYIAPPQRGVKGQPVNECYTRTQL